MVSAWLAIWGMAAAKTPVRVASLDVSNSIGRGNDVRKNGMDPQRLWSNSAGAVAAMVAEIDADVVGLQDVCDSIAGHVGASGLPDLLPDYALTLFSNQKASFPEDGPVANATAVLWKKGRFELVDSGINWLGGFFDRPGRDPALIYGGGNRAVVWVRLRERTSGKEFYFMSANINGATYYEGGEKVMYYEVTEANSRNLVELACNQIVRPSRTPSIIACNMHAQPSSKAYKQILTASRWLDVRDQLVEETRLGPEADDGDLMNSVDEARRTGGRPCHLLVDGFEIRSYRVWRKKYPTADRTLHFPTRLFPIVSDLAL